MEADRDEDAQGGGNGLPAPSGPVDPDTFARLALRQVLSRLLKDEHGMEAVDLTALDVLVDLAQRYTEELGVIAQSFAEHAGRQQSNALDVHGAIVDIHQIDPLDKFRLFLNHLQAGLAAPGAAARPPVAVPPFPLEPPIKQRKIIAGSGPRPQHIPPHLPTFPDTHSFQGTPAPIDNSVDKHTRIKRKDLEKQQAEANLAALVEQQAQVPMANYEAQGFVDGAPNRYVAEQPSKPPVVVNPTPFAVQEAIKTLIVNPKDKVAPPQHHRTYMDESAQRAAQIIGIQHLPTSSNRDNEVVESLQASRKRAEAEDGDIDD